MGKHLPFDGIRTLGLCLLLVGLLLFLGLGLFYARKIYVSGPSAASNISITNLNSPPTSIVSSDELGTRYQTAFLGTELNPKYWGQMLWAGSDLPQGDVLPEGFRSIYHFGTYEPRGARADRIVIPSIGVDSEIHGLAIMDTGDSREYETPKYVVGHIPETANPGEQGNGWYFGHLETPIQNEGNVFQGLPQLSVKLRRYIETGEDPIYVMLYTAKGGFLYQVVSTAIVHRDDLQLYDSNQSQITLVTCYPRWIYDHRLLVTAELVGVRDS